MNFLVEYNMNLICFLICVCEFTFCVLLRVKKKGKVHPCTGTGSVQAVQPIGGVEV